MRFLVVFLLLLLLLLPMNGILRVLLQPSCLLRSTAAPALPARVGVNGVFVSLQVAHSIEGSIALVAQEGDVRVRLLVATQCAWSLKLTSKIHWERKILWVLEGVRKPTG